MASTSIPSLKVILVGEYGVGKSSLFRRFIHDTFVSNSGSSRTSTIGLDNFDKVFKISADESVKIQLWDTGGMERIASVTSSYYKHSEAAVLVYAVDSMDSFNALSQHILDIVAYAETAKIFLCGTKMDLTDEIVVSNEDVEAFQEQCHNLVSSVYRVSSKSNEGVHEMMEDIAKVLAKQSRQHIDPDTFTVKHSDSSHIQKKSCAC